MRYECLWMDRTMSTVCTTYGSHVSVPSITTCTSTATPQPHKTRQKT